MKLRRLLIIALVLGEAVTGVGGASAPQPGNRDADALAALRPGHPRLLITPDTWPGIMRHARTDPQLQHYLEALVAEARSLLDRPPVTYRKIGRRLLDVSRTAEERILVLASAWHLTGDERLLRRAEAEMIAVCRFADWNPAHYLDTAEMTAALALGYDWLHGALKPEVRTEIRLAIAGRGLHTGLDPRAPHNGWHRSKNNWNQVCWGSLTLGAFAVAEDEPELARSVLSAARRGIVAGLEPYAPDGVYPEGPTYWGYGTMYQVLLIASLQSALGDDWGLTASPGFLASAGAVRQAQGPSGYSYNFADGAERNGFEPALFWFARQAGDPGLLQANASWLRDAAADRAPAKLPHSLNSRFAALAALWWPDSPLSETAPALPRCWLGRGANPIVAFRSSWSDPGSLYLAAKGGAAAGNHAHMDAGSFVLESDGVRWASDLGAQNYESLESKKIDLWNRAQDSQRWQVFRLNNHGHGTLTIDGQLHRVFGRAEFTRFADGGGAGGIAAAVLDLSPVFAGQARQVHRGFHFAPGEGVVVRDELEGLRPGATVRWAMFTRADVTIEGATATLRRQGKVLRARISGPAGAEFRVLPATPPEDGFNAPNPGVSILVAEMAAGAEGRLSCTVELAPGTRLPDHPPELPSLDCWGEPAVR